MKFWPMTEGQHWTNSLSLSQNRWAVITVCTAFDCMPVPVMQPYKAEFRVCVAPPPSRVARPAPAALLSRRGTASVPVAESAVDYIIRGSADNPDS